jgi:hypothetical protein
MPKSQGQSCRGGLQRRVGKEGTALRANGKRKAAHGWSATEVLSEADGENKTNKLMWFSSGGWNTWVRLDRGS